MLTLSTVRATGEARWFLTKATALRDETGATLAVNVIEDLTEERAAYDSLAEVAHTLQASLLPDALPEVAGWELASHYRPGQSGTQVGGDFYDVFPVAGGHMVLLGDVTGQGRRRRLAHGARAPHGAHGRPLRPAPGRRAGDRRRARSPSGRGPRR